MKNLKAVVRFTFEFVALHGLLQNKLFWELSYSSDISSCHLSFKCKKVRLTYL